MIFQCPTHGAIPEVEACPICDSDTSSIREMCRRVLVEWVRAWPEPLEWKHEVGWRDGAVAVMSQKACNDQVWSTAAIIHPRDFGFIDLQALRSWNDMHKTACQQG